MELPGKNAKGAVTIAEFKLTLIKGHTPENNYDGYDPHRHWELLKMPVADYLSRINAVGLVYPDKSMADLILSPWQLPWIQKNVNVVGYDFLQEVDSEHSNLYAFGSLHDGIDGQATQDAPGTFVTQVKSGYTNINGKRATADIYEVEVDSVLELWQTQQGIAALDSLNGSIVFNPTQWKHSLSEPVPQWLFWSIVQRLKGGS